MICSICGKDLTECARILGKESVKSLHTRCHEQEHLVELVERLRKVRNCPELPSWLTGELDEIIEGFTNPFEILYRE